MTRAETQKLRKAIALLVTDEADGGDYHAAMGLLLDLVGEPRREELPVERISFADAISGKFSQVKS